MYRMSIITMLAPPALSSRLNIAHCTKMALVHDMAELLVGDITPVDGVSEEEKHRREGTTMDYLTTKLLGTSSATSDQAQGIRDIFHEYEENQTLEAKFVHDVDKVELMLQMVEYERSQGDGSLDLSEFGGVASRIQLDEVKAWANEILEEREAFWKEKGTSS
jgi:putative hydrolase of HD superfamily